MSDLTTALAMMQQMLDNMVDKIDQMDSAKDMNNSLSELSTILTDMKTSEEKGFKSLNESMGKLGSYLNDIKKLNSTHTDSHGSTQYGPPPPPGMLNQSNMGIDNSQLELLNKNLGLLSADIEKQNTVLDEFNKEAKKREEEEEEEHSGAIKALKGISEGIKRSTHGASQLKKMATGAADIPFFSGMVKAMDPTIDSFRQMVRAGAGFNGSVLEMRKEASDAGLTLNQFTKAITEGGQGIRMLGPQTFSKLTKSVNDSVASMGDMGMTGDDIASNMGIFLDGLRTSGRLMTVNAQNVNMAFRDMTLQADQLAASLGITREEAMKQINKSASDPNIMFLQSLLRGRNTNQDASRNLQDLDAQFSRSPILGKLMRNIEQGVITNNPIDRDSQRLAQGLGLNLQDVQANIRSILNMSKEDAKRAMADFETNLYNGMKRTSNTSDITGSIQMLTGNNDIYGNVIGARAELEQMGVQGKNLREAPTAPNGTGEDGLTKTLSATNHILQENMVKFEAANTTIMRNQERMIEEGIRSYQEITSAMTTGITTAMTALSTMLTPLTNALGGLLSTLNHNIFALIGVVVAGKMATLALTAAINRKAGQSFLDSLLGGDGKKGKKGRRGKGGKILEVAEEGESLAKKTGSIGRYLKTGGRLLGHGAGIASLAYGIYDASTAYNRWNDVDEQEKEGKISKNQASYLHKKDIGGMVGEWGAGAVGTMVGAGLGTVLFPGLGTVGGAALGASLGGAVSGLAGHWAGSHVPDIFYTPDSQKSNMAKTTPTPVPNMDNNINNNDNNNSSSNQTNPNNPIDPNNPTQQQNMSPVNPQNNPQFPLTRDSTEKTISDLYNESKIGNQIMQSKFDDLNNSFQDIIRAIRQSGNNLNQS